MSSEDFDMNDSTWMSADPHLASSLSPSQDERMRSPQNLHSQEDGECLSVADGGEAVQDNRVLGIWARTSGGGPGLQVPPQCSPHLRGPHCPAPGSRETRSFLPKINGWLSGTGHLTAGIMLACLS